MDYHLNTLKLKTKQQHIAFLTPGFVASKQDTTTIPALQVFLKSIRKHLPNTKLSLIAFQFPYQTKPYQWHGIDIIPLNGKNNRFKKLWTWQKANQTLKILHKTQKIDTIHSFWIGECSLIGERFSKKHNINHVVTVMGQDATVKNRYAKYLKNSKSKIVTLSKNHQIELLKTKHLSSSIIPWHLDNEAFPELKKTTIDILAVGSLNTVKNYSDFIEIIYEINRTHKNLNVNIIGKGTLKPIITSKIKHLKLENVISLLGELPRPEVLNKMAQANILLHTSQYESFGFVFLEALYSGMQIASYNVGLANASKQWLIANNKTALIMACKTLLENTSTEKKRAILSDETKTVTAYIALYNA